MDLAPGLGLPLKHRWGIVWAAPIRVLRRRLAWECEIRWDHAAADTEGFFDV